MENLLYYNECNSGDSMRVRVRFAPSPTGNLHVGGARTAYYNWLFARKNGGEFVLRIEDTDRKRSKRTYEENIIEDLEWLGIDWDDFYRQSERFDIYRDYADRLLDEGRAYHCYCRDEELKEMRRKAQSEGRPPGYDGRCRNLTSQEKKKFQKEGREPTIRFKISEPDKSVVISDLIKGEVEFDRVMTGDFILIKSDGTPTYNLAATIDDHLMGITHVLRAEEHLSNTPKQKMLYQALGFTPPKFGHLPLLLGEDRKKLSKRHGSVMVRELREKGYLPETLKNYFALLGWSSKDEQEIFSESELLMCFSLENMMRSPQVFDFDKLDWLNNHYLQKADLERITKLAIPWIKKAGYLKDNQLSNKESQKLKRIVDLLRPSISNLSELKEHKDLNIFFEIPLLTPEAKEILNDDISAQVLESFLQTLEGRVEISPSQVTKLIKKVKEELDVGFRQVYEPLRAAITGKTSGPEINQVISILGTTETQKRLQTQFDTAQTN